ncbi:MAG: hypothetical protein H6687_02850 [Bacillales bacterium]|nr:hypothetical protein [Bacillales bacterium]
MDKDSATEKILNLMKDFTDLAGSLFNVSKDKAFIAASYLLSQKKLPYFSSLKENENREIQGYFDRFHEIDYKPYEMRRAFKEAYLFSLREMEKVNVDTTLELPLLYLKMITETIFSKLNYEHTIVLNPSSNDGSLAQSLADSQIIKEEDLYVIEERNDFLRLSENLRDLSAFNYKIQDSLPRLSFKADIIVSDPFLRSVEDILIFFEDYIEYLNNDGFMVIVLMNEFVRSRVFTDNILKYKLVLIGIIEYPKDLLDGLIDSSIVILEKKNEMNNEFFTVEMPSIKKIEDNLKVMNNIKEYIDEYIGGSTNENNVN